MLILVACVIFLLLGVYLYRFLLRIVELTKYNRKSRATRLIVALISIALLFTSIKFIGYGLVLLMHIIVIAWIVDGVYYILKKFTKTKKENERLAKLYKSGLIPILLTSIILCYGYFNMYNVVETDYQVNTKKNIRKEGYTIAMISDLHYPTTMHAKSLTSYCQEISMKNPDFVVLGGDIVDERTSHEEMVEALRIIGKIKNKYGMYYVYGNHDSAGYSRSPNFTKEELYNNLILNGIKVLEDEVVTVNNEITLLGRANVGYGNDGARAEQKELLQQVDTNDFLLMLDHQPKELKENASLGIDMQLSGHTHAGQLWPAGIIGQWLGANEQNYGLRKDGNFVSIVSSGIAGWGNKLRTAKHSEYVIIELKPE